MSLQNNHTMSIPKDESLKENSTGESLWQAVADIVDDYNAIFTYLHRHEYPAGFSS